MVRTIKPPRSLQKGERTVLLPGATEAEPWEVWSVGSHSECIQVCQKPEENKFGKSAILALPVSQVYGLPLWLNETDPKQFRGIIGLQLEARGLQPRGREAIFNWSIIAEEGARRLVLVAVLPALQPVDLETDACETFDLSARLFPLPPNAVVLWREQDRLVVAITRGTNLACFNALSETTLSSRTVQDLICLRAGLQMQGVVNELKQLVLWMDASPAELGDLRVGLGLPVRQETRPSPVVPAEPWNLMPARVDEVKRGRVARQWQRRVITLVIVCFLLVAAALAARVALTWMEVGRLQRWSADHARSLQLVHDTQAAWKDLRPVVDENSYPLELLLHVSESVPTDQLHLTLFETGSGHVLIKAEAKNLTAAFQLLDKLKKDPHFAGYTWEMAQPHTLANDVTQLQIEGTAP
jgi:hypothetical protein